MALDDIERYDPDRVSTTGRVAIVVGGGISGLVTARVLADAFERVVVCERGRYPDQPNPRRNVPQSEHPHILLTSGKAVLSDLFSEFDEALLSAGGLVIDWSSDLRYYEAGGYLASGPRRIPMYLSSRPLLEHVLRELLVTYPGVELCPETPVVGYLTDVDNSRVEGVAVPNGNRTHDHEADLVVDATGRTSRTPGWLVDHGYEEPPVQEVHIDMSYRTVSLDRPEDDRRLFFVPPSAPRTRGGGVFPIEGGRWIVTLYGMNGDAPSTEPDGFTDFAASLPVDDISGLLERRHWLDSEIKRYPFPASRWRHYEKLDRFPDGLLVVGDAIASFNPVYGQGMSVAAMQALLLHHALARDGSDVRAVNLFDEFVTAISTAWRFTVGNDVRFSGTDGPTPPGTALFTRYVDRLLRTAHRDGRVANQFAEIAMLERPLWRLFHPRLLWQVYGPLR